MRSKTNIGNCQVENCTKPATAVKKCSMHYARLKRYGTLKRLKWKILKDCKIKNCNEKFYSMEYCKSHYFKLKSNPRYSKNRIQFKEKSILLKKNPRIGICSKCGKKGLTQLHHEKYDKFNPLNHTIEVCPRCHTKETWRLGQIKGRPKNVWL